MTIETHTLTDLDRNESKCSVKLIRETDYKTKDNILKDFTKRVAILAFGIKSDNWEDVIKAFPELEQERKIVEKHLKENVKVDEIKIMSV